MLIALLIYRVGTHIPVPGIDPEQLSALFDQNQGTILGLANVFSGGALERMSISGVGHSALHIGLHYYAADDGSDAAARAVKERR